MMGGMDYWLGQLLSLIFYIMTLIVYNRARKEYVGGKIAAAINLIMIFLLILFVNDFVDYFLVVLVPLAPDIITILKILIKLVAICVLFFGGLRFFSTKQTAAKTRRDTGLFDGMNLEVKADPSLKKERDATSAYDIPRQVQKPTLGRYEIIGQIGKGAMGIVYKGWDPKLNRLTAIKTIRFMDEFDEDKVEAVKASFYREAELVAKLSHKNIVTIFDVGEDLDVSYLAMEYLEGESLEQYALQGDRLPIEKCIDVIIQVCDALEYAHGRNIIHRDIKPANIMVLSSGLVKVMDFGIARAAGGTKTKTGIIKGTPFYMSPEQAKGQALTNTSDIFSLGIVFYQLLTGKLPFSGDTMASIIYQTANVDPEPAVAFNSSISQPLLHILDKSLNKMPKERFQSAGAMASELRALIPASTEEQAGATKGIQESAKGILTGKSPGGLEQVPAIKSIREGEAESLHFDDLDQVLTVNKDFDVGKEAAFKTTENLSPPKEIEFQENDITSEAMESKLDLSELREVLAQRKRRLAHEDRAAIEDKPDAAQGSEKAEWGWRSGTGLGIDPEKIKRPLSALLRPAVFIAVTIVALAGATYYFWLSPKAEYRLAKIVIDKYFGEKPPSPEEMLAEQKRLVEQIMKEKLLEKQRLAKPETSNPSKTEAAVRRAEETQKEQQRIVQEKIAAERKKEQERQTAIKAAEQKEKERRDAIEAAKQRERERLARIAEEKRKAAALAQKQEQDRIEKLVNNDIQAINDLVLSAQKLLQSKQYADAKNKLEMALRTYQASAYKADPRLGAWKQKVEAMLATDEMTYGANGYVYYKNQWLTPQDYEKSLYNEGYVKYQGEFVQYQTLENVILNKTKGLVTSFVTEKFKGTMVHSKNVKLIDLSLQHSSSDSSRYQVKYNWEAWTFKGLEEGTCSIVVSYGVSDDKWYLVKGCE